MKVLIIGLGSMGKRRLRLIAENLENLQIVGVDSNEERRKQAKELYNIKTYEDLEEALFTERPNASFVCTAPVSHASIILKCLKAGVHVFTELNLIDDNYNDIIAMLKETGLKLFLSSTLMYRDEINFVKHQVNSMKKKVSYRYHVGQYLPDWHPWENYKDFFVADKRTNGCRELMAIEFPWIINTFGEIENIFSISNKITSLDLGYDDNYTIVFCHKNGNVGSINIDVCARKPVRNLEIYNDEILLKWGGTPETLCIYDINTKLFKQINTYEEIKRDERYSYNIIENAYVKEIQIFFKYIMSDKTDDIKYTLLDDLYTLSIIDEIEGTK